MHDVDEGAMWLANEDTVRLVLPFLPFAGCVEVARDLRLEAGGRWDQLPPPFAARRELLLAEVAERGREIGGEWPWIRDLLPLAPDDVSGFDPGEGS